MIKKNTRAIFRSGEKEIKESLVGGIPLSVGEIMKINNSGGSIAWKVVDKSVEYNDEGENQNVNVTYVFERA